MEVTQEDINAVTDEKIEEAVMSAIPSIIRLIKRSRGKIGTELRSIIGANKTTANYTLDYKLCMRVDIADETAINTEVTLDWPRKNGKDFEKSVPTPLNVPVKPIKDMLDGFVDPAMIEERQAQIEAPVEEPEEEPPVG